MPGQVCSRGLQPATTCAKPSRVRRAACRRKQLDFGNSGTRSDKNFACGASGVRFGLKFLASRGRLGSLSQTEFELESLLEVPMWTKPVYIELRLGFESTLYISSR